MAFVEIQLGIIGDKELVRKLLQLDTKLRSEISRAALGIGGTMMLQAMRKTVPRGRTGNLRRSLSKKVKQYPSGVSIAVIGPRIPMGAHAHLLEAGTEERVQQKTGRRVGRGPALWWMSKAFGASRSAIVQRMTTYLANRLRTLGA